MTSLPYIAHGVTLAFAWFVLVNLGVSVLVALIAARWLDGDRRAGAAWFWFGLRVSPALVAAVFVTAIFLPSYWKYEPREAVERFDLTLAALAAAAIVMLAAACTRGASAWWQAARRGRVWMRSARPLESASAGIPAFEIDAPAPMMALAGIVRPRLFVTRTLVGTLTADELEASVAHELGHWRARDNLKRLAMRAAPDFLFMARAARALERRWASAAEHSADRAAGGVNPAARCALASALVKLARLMPEPGPLDTTSEPISTLVGGGELASRVARLLDDPSSAPNRRPLARAAALATLGFAALALAYGPLLHAVHDATEILVRSLP